MGSPQKNWGDIQKSLQHYIKCAQGIIRLQLGLETDNGETVWRMGIIRAVGTAEKDDEFVDLVSACQTGISSSNGNLKSKRFWIGALKCFFFFFFSYCEMASGSTLSSESLLQRLRKEVQRTECPVTYLALVEGIDLADEEISFGEFRLQRLQRQDLEDFLNAPMLRVFYPRAVEGIDRLAGHYFLVATGGADTRFSGRINVPGLSGKVQQRPTMMPLEVERGLKILALYDWQPRWALDDQKRETKSHIGWQGFSVPALIALTDDSFDVPQPLPTAEIDMEPVLDQQGRDVGLRPMPPYFKLDETETAKFGAFLKRMSARLDRIYAEEDASRFLKVATDFLLRAQLCGGMEQLLWHITAIEAVLSEDKPGVTKLLCRRLGLILGETKKARKDIAKRFGKLYDFRCRLVHGKEGKPEVFQGHLAEARRFARATVCWGIRAFDHVLQKSKQMGEPDKYRPRREDLLRLLDLDEQERDRLSAQTFWLPDDFPCVSDWTE